MRKLVSLVLAIAMLLSLTAIAHADDVYTLDIYWIGNADNTPVREGVQDAINAYIEPLIGAHVEFHIIGYGEWNDKAINALQSGEKMDLIWTADWKGYMAQVNGGLLTELDDLLAQYGQGILDTLPEKFLDGTRVNGKLYGIPTNKELCVPGGFIINATAAKEIGWDVVDNDPTIMSSADLEPWLAKYKELHPNSYPYMAETSSFRWADEPWVQDWIGMTRNFVAMKVAPDANGQFDETIYKIFTTDEERAYLEMMYRWGQAGYINPDAALTSYNIDNAYANGDFLAYSIGIKGNDIKSAELYAAGHNVEFDQCEILMRPKCVITTHAGGSMFGIPVTSKAPEIAMEYINLMHSDATLANLMLYGAKDVNYTLTDDGRVVVNPDANWYGVHGGAWTVGNTALHMVTETEDPEKNKLLQSYADDAVPTISLGFRFITDNVVDEVAACSEIVERYAVPMMCGIVDPADPELGLDAMNSLLEDAGIDSIVAEAQTQYDAWKAAQE